MSCPDRVLSLSHPATFDALPWSKEPTRNPRSQTGENSSPPGMLNCWSSKHPQSSTSSVTCALSRSPLSSSGSGRIVINLQRQQVKEHGRRLPWEPGGAPRLLGSALPPAQPCGLGQDLPSLDRSCGCPFSLQHLRLQLKPNLSTWIPAPGPTLLGAVLSGGWSRPRVALVSIQVSHPGFHKHCRLGPGFRRMNKSIFTPAPNS